MEILVYQQEINDGVGDLIKSRSFSSIKSPVHIADNCIKKDKLKISLNSVDLNSNPDLYPLDYILMSTVWNENDDVFTPKDTFIAKATSVNKPLNFEHEFEKIVGHSIGYDVLDEEAKPIEIDSMTVDSLPEKFHLKGTSVIYQIAHTDEQQQKLDSLINDVKTGKYFISVEALFPNFDYMLKASNGECKIVERNKSTSFLTKYLRIYNGSGVYGEYRVGRVPRNIIFSGQALVLQPANPESIIFAKKNEFLSFSKIQMVYELKESKNKEVKMENDNKELVASLQKQISELTDKNVKLQASISENDFNKVKTELENKVIEIKGLNDEVTKLKAAVVEKDTVIASSQKQTEDAVKQLNEVKEKLGKIEAENKFNIRAGLIKDKLKISDAKKVDEMVVALASLNDEQFSKYIELQASLIPTEVKLEAKVEDLKKIEPEKNISTNSVDTKVTESEDKLTKDLSNFAESVFKAKYAKAKFNQ